MTTTHNLGFPRIGVRRELKFAVERYWRGDLSRAELEAAGQDLRARHWRLQAECGLDLVPVNDCSWYDHVLDMAAMLGVVPSRFGTFTGAVDLDTYFRMARGRAPTGAPAPACEMTKWFDTNYHYLVPELGAQQTFHLATNKLFDEVIEAKALGLQVKPVILGPLSFLWLGKSEPEGFDRLSLLERLLPVYGEILDRLAAQGVKWAQIDEPILSLDLSPAWRQAFQVAYHGLAPSGLKLLLTTYFGGLGDNLPFVVNLPVAGLHIDAVRAPDELVHVLDLLPVYKVLSLGLIDGRNVWRADLENLLALTKPVRERIGAERLWLAPSCSLLHVPIDLDEEVTRDTELRAWLAFARQKITEVTTLKRALDEGREAVQDALAQAGAAVQARRRSGRIHRSEVAARLHSIQQTMTDRQSPYAERAPKQHARFKLPLYPTTTIGSFPQTGEIRKLRRAFKEGALSEDAYTEAMRDEISQAIHRQERYGLDVLVHGEAERTDMVEYFAEQLEGFAVTHNGWVQSYGTRCVKPPILYGDVVRSRPMTVPWITYAQSLTQRPVKGMLTGPVTMLQWSFVRDDQSRATTCLQLALALRDEVADLERAGIGMIQMDEPAFREGLPLRRADWPAYLEWAVKAFRIATSGVADDTQIHTHMCYSEFNDVIEAIAALDADVITIETARSNMALLEAFVSFAYPNEIGPGVYDIHSPNVPSADDMTGLIHKAAQRIPSERLWVNPDCGLKTRGWPEVEQALINLVAAARQLRQAG